MITVNSKLGKKFGFTSKIFSPNSYLWEKNGSVILSMIIKNPKYTKKGAVILLISKIEASGYTVKVPTPFPAMQHILTKLGFGPTIEVDELMGPVEIWKRKIKTAANEGSESK